MSQVWEGGPETHAELLVLLALADFSDDQGMCWPSMPTLARKARMSERNARRIIRKLQDSGHLVVEENRGRNATNRYWVKAKPDNLSGLDKTGQIGYENRTNRARKPDTAMSDKPSRTIKEPSNIHQVDFDAFWNVCPRKVGKGAARAAYAKAVKKADPQSLFSAMSRYAQERDGKEQQYTVHPATWLNQERWMDEPQEQPTDFHKNFEAMLRGESNGLQLTDQGNRGTHQSLSSPVQAAGTHGQRSEDGESSPDRGGNQSPYLSLIQPKRFGGSR
jgi:hypothetical protein